MAGLFKRDPEGSVIERVKRMDKKVLVTVAVTVLGVMGLSLSPEAVFMLSSMLNFIHPSQ